jgi:hypothetical protein
MGTCGPKIGQTCRQNEGQYAEYVTDFMEVSIKLRKLRMMIPRNATAGDLVGHTGLFFCKVAYTM